MGMDVELTLPPITVELAAARRRALLVVAAELMAVAAGLAPTEPEPKHGVHLRETAFVRLEAALDGGDQVAIGFDAFWAIWMHEWMDVAHPHGGQAKFLELPVVEGGEAAMEKVAALIREAIEA
ncbi:hypothetical protein SAMN05444157_1623 [Frankineae bacterium MT45]|nr:hypothetical protein SAMN05444157_1623 [Frankineae bacterium MT45]